jgi:hypothetical protein
MLQLDHNATDVAQIKANLHIELKIYTDAVGPYSARAALTHISSPWLQDCIHVKRLKTFVKENKIEVYIWDFRSKYPEGIVLYEFGDEKVGWAAYIPAEGVQ